MNHIRPGTHNPYAEDAAYHDLSRTIHALERMTDEERATYMAQDDAGYDTRDDGYRVCRVCHQSGYAGEYPFSTLGGDPLCDDCV